MHLKMVVDLLLIYRYKYMGEMVGSLQHDHAVDGLFPHDPPDSLMNSYSLCTAAIEGVPTHLALWTFYR